MANQEMRRPREYAKYWSDPQVKGLELLRATFVTHAFPRHTHEEQFVIGAVEEGTQLCFNTGTKHYLPAGTIVLLNPDTPHTGVTVDENGYRYRALYPNIALMRDIQHSLGIRSSGYPDCLSFFRSPYSFYDPEVARRIIGLHELLESSATVLERDTRLLSTLALLFRRYGEHRTVARDGSETRAVRDARAYLQAHACESISLNTLASAVGLSPFHLVRVFRQQVGVPPHAYQTQLRVQIAHQLLRQGTPVAQAAVTTGFVDQSHLTRHFKRLTGVAPGAFQRASRSPVDGELAHRNIVQA